jgi:hypothetical protein
MKLSNLERISGKLPTAKFVTNKEFLLEQPAELTKEFLRDLALNQIKSYETSISLTENLAAITHFKKLIKNLRSAYFNEEREKSEVDDDYEEEIYQDDYSMPQEVLNLNFDFPNLDIERIYKKMYIKYKNAMERKEGRSPLPFTGFVKHYFEENFYNDTRKIFGNDEKGYLLGMEENGIFIPMHFAPANLRLGASLINDLNVNNIPTCFFIPEDLRDTIVKLPGWKTINYPIPMNFRGKTSIKYPVFNNLRAVLEIIKKEYSKFKDRNEFSLRFKNYLKKLTQIFIKDSKNTNEEVLEEILKEIEFQKGF